ncbi:MAG: hypothetical protein JWM90_3010 [Thermoleophilia bacterium]|nr:hypothetical protein [Thermoleophilia bacterium]
MSCTRFPAIDARRSGELWLTDSGLEFVPALRIDDDQLGLAWEGWQLPWSEICAVERVRAPADAVRIHHADFGHFQSLRLGAEIDAFLTAFDARVAARRARDSSAA